MDKNAICKKALTIAAYDVLASIFLGISIVCFAVEANFAPGGVNGLAVMANYLFGVHIGLTILIINIPIVIFTYRKLGRGFFLMTIKSMIISAFFIDYVVCWLPVYHGSRMIASILAGTMAGIGYSLFFNEGSSTGGTDFIVAAVKKDRPNLSFGILVFLVDVSVIILSVFVFREIWSFVYGMVHTVVTSLALDATTKVLSLLRRS